jgi:6-pyruvoyltetrahydropterin/6-carboxytetrahydropterin synthase
VFPVRCEQKAVGMFEVSVDETFSAGHALRGYRGKCENPHGHNYKVRVTLQGPELDSIGLLYDFVHLKCILRGVISELDHRFLNDQAPFDAINPSAENIARYLYDQASQKMSALEHAPRIASVTVWETDTSSATFRP